MGTLCFKLNQWVIKGVRQSLINERADCRTINTEIAKSWVRGNTHWIIKLFKNKLFPHSTIEFLYQLWTFLSTYILVICCGLFILWILFFELVLKRKGVIAKFEASKNEYEAEQEFLSSIGALPKCEVCGQLEHTTEEHYTRNMYTNQDTNLDGVADTDVGGSLSEDIKDLKTMIKEFRKIFGRVFNIFFRK